MPPRIRPLRNRLDHKHPDTRGTRLQQPGQQRTAPLVVEFVERERRHDTAVARRALHLEHVGATSDAIQSKHPVRPARLSSGPRMHVDAQHRRAGSARERPRRAGDACPAPEVDHAADGGCGRAKLLHDALDGEKVQRSVEQAESGPLAGSLECGASAEPVAALDIGRRQSPERPRHLREAKVRKVSRLQRGQPPSHALVVLWIVGLAHFASLYPHGHPAGTPERFPAGDTITLTPGLDRGSTPVKTGDQSGVAMKIRGAELVRQALEDEGVRFTFGIPGTHNIELYNALHQSDQITAVLVTDEQSAGFMADGVSRVSAQIGVVNLVPGAGVTHALSGIAEALLDNIPLVILACAIRGDTGRAYQLHEIDQTALLRPVTKAVLQPASPDAIYATIRQAFDLARSGAPGPVAVELRADYLMLTHEVAEPLTAPAATPPHDLDDEALQAAAAVLNAARHPLLYVGYGARGASQGLVELAERLGAPVATTIQGKGVFPESHALWLWNGLGASSPPFAREIAGQADAMLAIGCRFGEVGTASYGFTPPAHLVHVDIDAGVFDRNFPARVRVPGDAGRFVRAILPLIDDHGAWGPRAEHLAVGHRRVLDTWARETSPDRVTPAVLFATLQRQAPDAVYVTDSGNGTFLAMEHLRLMHPSRFLAPVDYSCMGYAVPAAVGAKLADPQRDVIALSGDGALLMTGLELLTAAAYGAAPIVCVLCDGELAQIAQFQRTALAEQTASTLPPYSVEAFARMVGAEHVRLAKDSDAERAIRHALGMARGGTPVVVDVAIDYSHKTYFTRGVISTMFWRLPWPERVRMLGRAAGRHLKRRLEPEW